MSPTWAIIQDIMKRAFPIGPGHRSLPNAQQTMRQPHAIPHASTWSAEQIVMLVSAPAETTLQDSISLVSVPNKAQENTCLDQDLYICHPSE